MKPIRLSGHAQENMRYRGATEPEVIEAIQTAAWSPAERGRLECRKNFAYGQEWNGKFHVTKQVRPIFVEESEEIVVVTVYVYYF
ncbi:MAG: hypothetical protein ONB44_21700 [candidate division KSB1 bacterium]|nr:hypothetical protein [candidate division KSB1 bacterium]MDZ7304752.1 hypothetical protein [candidate division KSB1 bacterium]MDZ7314214.1 hypothetical protein [candidate division KSB1 bacterium]